MDKQLSAHELVLLKAAVPYMKELQRLPTQEELRSKLGCRSINAKNIQHFLMASEALKVAARLEATPARAEDKAIIEHSLGESGTMQSYLLVENNRLVRKLAKKKQERAVEAEQRAREIRQEIEELKSLAKQEIAKVRKPRSARPAKDTGLMMEISSPDLHAGKLAHSAETGGRPYDVKIAIATFNRSIDTLLERTSHYAFEEILLCVGNDLFNSDNIEGTTTGGTAVSNDGRFYKTFAQVRTMLVDTINRLREVAKVRIVICAGNHDLITAYHVGDSIECFFNADPQVVVENAPISRKYIEWGRCLIGFCHGHQEKHEDLGLLMASEQPTAWARTKFREWHLGHFHKLQTRESHGVRIRVLPALCSADDWHSIKGYVNNLRTAQAFIWSKNEGLIAEYFHNDDAFPEIKTRREIV